MTVTHKYGEKIGLSVQDATSTSFLPGVIITHVQPGTPASQAAGELTVGDLLVSVNNQSLVGLKLTEKLKMLR